MSKNRILVIEDEEDILALIHYNLVKAGYRVDMATSGETGLQIARDIRPDLIVLDLMLPNLDGLEVCRQLRAEPETDHIAIVMLTAKGEEEDIVAGLELGADDYLPKPFSPQVLLARIKAVLRRKSTGSQEQQAGTIVVRNLSIDPGRNRVEAAGREARLTTSEFKLLHRLASRPGWVFTRSQLIDAVHGEGYAVTDRSIDVQIVGLRKKLGPCGDDIETVRGIGYRFRE